MNTDAVNAGQSTGANEFPKVKVMYTAEATATGGRGGRTVSSDGRVDHELSIPKEMGGPGGEGTNPEQLFAAGYAACFNQALMTVASRQRKSAENSSVTASVGMGRIEGVAGRPIGFRIELRVSVPGLPREEAEALVTEAHKVCPYSNATRGNVDVTLAVGEAGARAGTAG